MIDWINFGSNILWIMGLALALATFSYASWASSMHNEKFISWIKKGNTQISLNIAGVLFSLGLTATSETLLGMVLWLFLAVLFLIQIASYGLRKIKL